MKARKWYDDPPPRGSPVREEVDAWPEEPTRLHEQRLSAVLHHLIDPGVQSVLDLGCGSGALLERLVANPGLRRIVGLDRSLAALAAADARLSARTGHRDERVALRQGTVTDADEDLVGFDAAALVETIEHVDPAQLSRLEHSLFRRLRPGRVVVTTPNREYNRLYGMKPGELRHPGHRFEWDRAKFERWSAGAADRNGYEVGFEGLGPGHPSAGSPSQMAIFRRIPG
jgi:small RNA 2'-O-methyltransferase